MIGFIERAFNLLPISRGGTGAANAADARANLGAVNKAGDTMTGALNVTPTIRVLNASAPMVYLRDSEGGDAGALYTLISNHRTILRENRVGVSGYEDFALPEPDASGASKTYNILTTKSAVAIAQGGTGATTKDGARTALTEPLLNAAWKDAPIGVSYYTYEGASTTDLDLPYGNVDVIVLKRSATRGSALAVRWQDISGVSSATIWQNGLYSTWKGWVKVAGTDAVTVTMNASGSDSQISGTPTITCRREGNVVQLTVGVTIDCSSGNAWANGGTKNVKLANLPAPVATITGATYSGAIAFFYRVEGDTLAIRNMSGTNLSGTYSNLICAVTYIC